MARKAVPSAANKLAEFLRVGDLVETAAAQAGGAGSRHAAARDVALHVGCRAERAEKAGWLAGIFTQQADRDTLIELGARTFNNESVLSEKHARFLLRLNDPAQILQWLGKAADGRWSTERLNAELKRAVPSEYRAAGGRKAKPPADFADFLDRVAKVSTAWNTRCAGGSPCDLFLTTFHGPVNAAEKAQVNDLREDLALLALAAIGLEDRLARLIRATSRLAARLQATQKPPR
jgi:hypothetical protein